MRILVLLLCGAAWRLYAYELQLGLGNQPQRDPLSCAYRSRLFRISNFSNALQAVATPFSPRSRCAICSARRA